MSGKGVVIYPGGLLRPGQARSGGAAGRPMPWPGWLPIALGVALAGFGRSKGSLVLLALGGAAALAVKRGAVPGLHLGAGAGPRQGQAQGDEVETERSLTIGRPADELMARWRDPQTLPQVMAAFATVRPSGEGRLHWRIAGPLGRAYSWESERVDAAPDGGSGWRSLPGADLPNEGSMRFRPAPADRGTVATLRFRLEPPGGALGHAAVERVGGMALKLVADGVLRRFKSLVETGEIPTTERQPAARADTR